MPNNGNGHEIGTQAEPTADLLGGLLSDAKELVSAHAQHIKLEVRDELGSLKDTIRLTGVAIAAVVLAGLLIAQAIAHGLSELSGLPLSVSFGIVGVAAAIAGYAVYRKRPTAVDLVPSESISAVKHDVERIAAAATS